MNETFILMLLLCAIICVGAGITTAIGLTSTKPLRKKKKYKFHAPANMDFKEKTFDNNLLYDKEIKGSVDGSNASEKFKKG